MNKKFAVFLDRDGTLIEYVLELTKPEQLKILPGAVEGVKALNEAGFLCIILTNQPIVEKGKITQAEAEGINRMLAEQFTAQGARIDAAFVCPHRFKEPQHCTCRKPDQGMVQEAVKKFDIDLSQSFMVGDSLRDIETGKRGGMKTILVQTNPDGNREDDKFFPDAKPDYTVANMQAAAAQILSFTK
ncbi:MAG: HAD family hydrolase [Candidatus Liptonbacteria bacterium]|nr:HAD family hydrolase [Candidatus Liptonbacteria bacterium]